MSEITFCCMVGAANNLVLCVSPLVQEYSCMASTSWICYHPMTQVVNKFVLHRLLVQPTLGLSLIHNRRTHQTQLASGTTVVLTSNHLTTLLSFSSPDIWEDITGEPLLQAWKELTSLKATQRQLEQSEKALQQKLGRYVEWHRQARTLMMQDPLGNPGAL